MLVTGASGRIGSAFARSESTKYHLILADLEAPVDATAETTSIRLDVRDAEACRCACMDVDAVLHLAADPSPTADFMSALLPVNILGTYNLFQAAADAGVKRMVYASSAQAIEGYPLDLQVSEVMAPFPANLYGVSKAFGEALCAQIAYGFSMSVIAIRIANVGTFERGQKHSARDAAAFISVRDLNHLLDRALTADVTGFHVVHGVSNNRYKRLAIESTRRLLDYRPRDDAFEILGIPLAAGPA